MPTNYKNHCSVDRDPGRCRETERAASTVPGHPGAGMTEHQRLQRARMLVVHRAAGRRSGCQFAVPFVSGRGRWS